MKENGSEERRHGRWSDTSPSSTASAVSTADRGATDKHTQAMNAMAEMVRTLQIDVGAAAESKFRPKDKESMTTKRAFTMLPNYSGKVEEYENWRFQMIQF